MEVIDNLLSGIYVIVGLACVVVLIVIFFWSKDAMVNIETRGSSIALAEKLLSAPCLNMADAKGSAEKFVFNKAVLDTYNNKPVCDGVPGAPEVLGTTYHIEIKTGTETWHMNNLDEVYAYNTHARGVTKVCLSDQAGFLASNVGGLTGFKALYSSPFDYNGNILKYSGVVINNDEVTLASIKVIIDADSGTEFYPDGYPICLCDISCPYSKCSCSKKCGGTTQTVNRGEMCT